MTFENSDEGGESTQELQNLIKELGYRNAMDVEDVLTHPEENVVAQLLTDEEIIESVIVNFDQQITCTVPLMLVYQESTLEENGKVLMQLSMVAMMLPVLWVVHVVMGIYTAKGTGLTLRL
ncbi:hypothetical protein Tco_0053281 [Tanacetum coccineum]